MAYVAPIHRPTSVRHAIKINLISPAESCLVVAKSNRLEIYGQTAEGLQLLNSRTVYGKITVLEKIRPLESQLDHLLVGTNGDTYFVASWDEKEQQLRTEKGYTDQADKSFRDAQIEDRCVIDPTQSFVALLMFEGVVTILPIRDKARRRDQTGYASLGDPVIVRISDLFIRSFTFLHSHGKDKRPHKLAFLYEDNHQKVCLGIRALDYSQGMSKEPDVADLESILLARDDLELGASHLIPVPAPTCGLLVLCETMICYLGGIKGDLQTKELDHPTQFVTWTAIDHERWLLADDFGSLYLLRLIVSENQGVQDWDLHMLGKIPRAAVLVYLDDGLVFVGSHQGDSVLLRIQADGSIETTQTISNIGPILDMTIMDMGNRSSEGQVNEYSSGQARIVTGSGAFQDGSLRSVRSGVGLEEQGVLGEMNHPTELFALKSQNSRAHDDVLVVSFVAETRIFTFSTDGEVEEQESFKGLDTSSTTLLATNVGNVNLVQVTPFTARLLDEENGMLHAQYDAPSPHHITAVSSNSTTLALAIGGSEILLLDITRDLQVKARRGFPDDGQISCLHVPLIHAGLCLAGFWRKSEMILMRSENLETIATISLSPDEVAVPRSMLLTPVLADQDPTLFVALANGEVVTFSFDMKTMQLKNQKAMMLGTQQADFKALPREDGLTNCFAICEHPSLIYGFEGRINYSAVTAQRAVSICPFNSEAYPGAIAIATPEDLRLAVVDTERTTHVQTLPVSQTVRRIAYSQKFKTFGIGTIERTLRNTQEIVKSHFKLADEVLFKTLDTYELDEDELVESVTRAEVSDEAGELQERFVVGTAYLEDDKGDSIRGRILVFAVSVERSLKLITELPVKGACRALGSINGKIVAALSKTVVIFELRESRLQKLATYRTSTAPVDLAINPLTSQICVADLMKSLSIVTFVPAAPSFPNHRLTETARHYSTVWATACAYVDTDTWLEADAEGNLLVLRQNTAGITADDRRRLEVISEIRLGEMVNRIRAVQVEASANAPVSPKAFMATVDGGVYLYAQIAPAWLDLLMRLQLLLAPLVASLGFIDFNGYRAFRNQVREAEEPYRFVDGELIEAFLNLDAQTQHQVASSLGELPSGGSGSEALKTLVEGLKRLH